MYVRQCQHLRHTALSVVLPTRASGGSIHHLCLQTATVTTATPSQQDLLRQPLADILRIGWRDGLVTFPRHHPGKFHLSVSSP